MRKKLYAVAAFATRRTPSNETQIMPCVFNVIAYGEDHATDEQLEETANANALENTKRLAPLEEGWRDHTVFLDEVTAERLEEFLSDDTEILNN